MISFIAALSSSASPIKVLQPAILGLEFAEPLRLRHLHTAILRFPAVQCVLGDAVLADQLNHRPAPFMLLEHGDDLLFGITLAFHIGTSLG